MDATLRFIGTVRSELRDRKDAPKNEAEGAPPAAIVVDPAYLEGLDGLTVGQEIIVLTWLHLSDRDVLKVHPRNNKNAPKRGVFTTRSPARPNPIGFHRVRVTGIEEGGIVHVDALEAVDGTPVVDIKTGGRATRPHADHA
ncbi:tRNA (N6-threonylcarbamoyladenosine(37)-N6)-methyltransferase TrmO [Desulfovibrio sulfodismutans]|uniref:tRNA (N6-threonylcarbamoyladenosine(37)-N6)-methyltransferase TrmO n=1 Tax=Desulfolutivibrio sulfodismutans TaxID=63561 RepID=A0A7K3NRU2_9BACT|nr:tRNA (N6-threonylcarbamoyladenosine(37)-N6)-methyltransferase TrmO [Desulfolutivibrio sulfodismutans]QLA14356.1 tRNA (N6-threonylcarbamoyladenosine(37)-N6)-methyltransferase TrmO [Desulfolutivibrio sulfodismutans DSM 3696]